MYEERYSLDWDELDRDEAVERAFALGVVSEFGEEYPEEYDRLVGVLGRPLTQMAHDEGQTAARDLKHDLGQRTRLSQEDIEFPDRAHEIWSRLIEYHSGEQTELERSERPPGRLDVPQLLKKFDLSKNPVQEDGRERLDLPDFLYR